MIDIPDTIRYIQATHGGTDVTAHGRAADEGCPGLQRNGLCVRWAKGQGEASTSIVQETAVAQAIEPSPVKLIMGLIIAGEAPVEEARQHLEASYGKIDLETAPSPFVATHYYEREMGPQLSRMFWSFEPLIAPDALARIKRQTNLLEWTFAWWDEQRWRRRVNLDPGYVDLAKLVLATTKDRQHRLYLGQGIYGEVTLRFTGGRFVPWEWTYPDYRTPEYLAFFDAVRRRYRQQLTAQGAEPHHV